MAKEKINYSEMAAFFRQVKKHYRYCEHGEEMASAIVEQNSILSALRAEEEPLKADRERDRAILEELRINILSARKEIEVYNTEIVGKVNKTKEELSHYQERVSRAKTELNVYKAELQKIVNLIVSQKKELVDVSNEFDKKQKECINLETRANMAENKLEEVKSWLGI